jgi:hypothetical protein
MLTALNAVASTDLKIEAAIASLPKNVTRMLAGADINLIGKIGVADLDRRLAAATRLTNTDRLTIKIGLNRAGLLD